MADAQALRRAKTRRKPTASSACQSMARLMCISSFQVSHDCVVGERSPRSVPARSGGRTAQPAGRCPGTPSVRRACARARVRSRVRRAAPADAAPAAIPCPSLPSRSRSTPSRCSERCEVPQSRSRVLRSRASRPQDSCTRGARARRRARRAWAAGRRCRPESGGHSCL